mmetsp:Transcript_49249/g.142737  ORF Transcript_49249/g.142737 Transcript_49249/m.142737 type:complete len:420 (-) Transcript_49249:1525-2784(-)
MQGALLLILPAPATVLPDVPAPPVQQLHHLQLPLPRCLLRRGRRLGRRRLIAWRWRVGRRLLSRRRRRLEEVDVGLRGLEGQLQPPRLPWLKCAADGAGLQRADLRWWHQQVHGAGRLGDVRDDHRLLDPRVARHGGQVQLRVREAQRGRHALALALDGEVLGAEAAADGLEGQLAVQLHGRVRRVDHAEAPPLPRLQRAHGAAASALHDRHSCGVILLLLKHVLRHVHDGDAAWQPGQGKLLGQLRLVDNQQPRGHGGTHGALAEGEAGGLEGDAVRREHAHQHGLHRQQLVHPHDAHGDAEGAGQAPRLVAVLQVPVQKVFPRRELDLDRLLPVALEVGQGGVELQLLRQLLRLLHLDLHSHRLAVPHDHARAEDVPKNAGLEVVGVLLHMDGDVQALPPQPHAQLLRKARAAQRTV